MPEERYILTCMNRAWPDDPRTLVESYQTSWDAAAAEEALREEWDSVLCTIQFPLRTTTGRELLAGGRLQ